MNLADILDAMYESTVSVYEEWEALSNDVRNHPLIYKPNKPVSREQFINAQLPRSNWNMRGVVTGARRQWKGKRK